MISLQTGIAYNDTLQLWGLGKGKRTGDTGGRDELEQGVVFPSWSLPP